MRHGKGFLALALIAAGVLVGGAEAQTDRADAPAAAAPMPVSTTPLPRAGRIEYALQYGDNGMTFAHTVHEWHHDGNNYVLTGVAETVGIVALFKSAKIVQRSEGSLEGNVLKPSRFRLDRGDGHIESGSLDWQRMVATITGGREWQITRGTQDGLSIFYQIGRFAMPTAGLELDMASGRKVERYAFDWLSQETVSVPAGEYKAWRVRIHATSGDPDLKEVWLATAANLPVKIRTVDRKGKVLVMVAEKLRFQQ